MGQRIVEVGHHNFETEVVERSRQVPVVVDFWAPWCGPCRFLGPILERLAEEQAGAFVLTKVNVDENPALAAAFGVRGIPAVKAFRNATVVAEFVGALPELEVKAFIERLLPSEADHLAVKALRLAEAGSRAEAEAIFCQALAKDGNHSKALFGLARILADRGAQKEALTLLERIPPETEERREADQLAARLRLMEGAGEDEKTLRSQLAVDPSDLPTRFRLARTLAAQEQYAEALEHFLHIVKRDRGFGDDVARKAMLQIFEVLGPDNDAVQRFRSELAKVLFR